MYVKANEAHLARLAAERLADEQERTADALESIAGVLKLVNESGLLGRMNAHFEHLIAARENRPPML